MKEIALHQQEAGYSLMPGTKFVCAGCVTDRFLKEDIGDETDDDQACSYCGAVPAADLTVLLDSVADYLGTEYEDPVHRLPYDGREGGYQGVVHDGYELVSGLAEWSDCDDLIDDVATRFAGSAWCQRDYFSLKDDDKLRYGWAEFVDLIKHHTRFLFFPEHERAEFGDEAIAPNEMLVSLGELINSFELFSSLPRGREIVRARVYDSGSAVRTVDELGPRRRIRRRYPTG